MNFPVPIPFFRRLAWTASLLLLLPGLLAPARADDPLPQPFPADRYSLMAAHSPFAPPTEPTRLPPAPTAPPVPSWSDKLTVNHLMQDHGLFYATVVDPDSLQHLYLNSATQDTNSHLRVADVKWTHVGDHDVPTVTLVRDNVERAQVRYDPGEGAASPTAAMAMPNAPRTTPLPGTFAPNTYHPPSVQGNPVVGIPAPASTTNFQRRAPIRAVPPPPAAGGAGRPVVLPGQAPAVPPARPGPQQLKTDDEDDDD